MKLFGLTISRTPPDPELQPGEIPVYAVLHEDGRIGYLGQTEASAVDVIRNSRDDKLYVLKLAARFIRAT
jgi:hypothetical protein